MPIFKPAILFKALLADNFTRQLEVNEPRTILHASEIEERYNVSFGDALIVAAASQAKVAKILTEDLQAGQLIEGILIENPFFHDS